MTKFVWAWCRLLTPSPVIIVHLPLVMEIPGGGGEGGICDD